MTESEAIEILNDITFQDCGRYPYGTMPKVRDMAIKALEKQIPKKVISKHKSVNIEEQLFYGEETFFGDCPHCGASNCSLWNDKNCGHCGQKLDWSDEE